MFRIYKITNKINGKVYIGRTSNGIHKRFKEHTNRAKYETSITRPLYSAMRKYGCSEFFVEEIETVKTKEEANTREKYWIKYYNSFGYNGYNATDGGDDGSYNAKTVLQISKGNYQIVREFPSTHEAGRFFGKSNVSIQRVCSGERLSAHWHYWIYKEDYDSENDIKQRFKKKRKSNPVLQIDLNTGETIQEYNSTYDAGSKLGIDYKKIHRVCSGERNSYKGYSWKFK